MHNKEGCVPRSCGTLRQIPVTAAFIVVAIFGCVASECKLLSAGCCGDIAQQLRGLLVDSRSQIGAVCVIAVFTIFLVAGRVYTTRKIRQKDVWFSALFVIGFISYLQQYDSVSRFPGAFVLFTGILIGELVRQLTLGSNSPTASRLAITVAVLASILVASICQTGSEQVYKYYGAVRWSGGWDNPNTCGLLMGVASVLAWGLLRLSLSTMAFDRRDTVLRRRFAATFCLLFIIQTAALVGLISTYSRGAWLGTIIALIYWKISTHKSETVQLPRWAKATLCGAAILAVTIAAAMSLRQNDAVIRRVVSPTTAHDFSSRNRIAAWIAGFQIMADHPFRGVGWNSPQATYDDLYKSAEVQAATAIETNDYIYIGAALGVPALVVLLSYVWTIIARVRNISRPRPNSSDHQLSRTLTAASIVLAVGFAFDGGLLSLPTGTAFWVLANGGDNAD